MKYAYTVVITPNEDGTKFYARVPDLPSCITSGTSVLDAIDMATDAAGGWLCISEDNGDPVIPASAQHDIPHSENDILSIISVDTIKYRAENDTRAVRKNVSLPAWMANLVDKRKINCSQVLQDGLMKILESA